MLLVIPISPVRKNFTWTACSGAYQEWILRNVNHIIMFQRCPFHQTNITISILKASGPVGWAEDRISRALEFDSHSGKPRTLGKLLIRHCPYTEYRISLNTARIGSRVNLPIQINWFDRFIVSTWPPSWFEPGWLWTMKLIKPQGLNWGFTVVRIERFQCMKDVSNEIFPELPIPTSWCINICLTTLHYLNYIE